MINATSDIVLTFAEASKKCPKVNGKRPSTVSMWRWATQGLHGVMLDHVRIGRRMLTTEDALNEFFRGVASARSAQRASKSSGCGAQRMPQSNAPAVTQAPVPNLPKKSTEKQREREISQARARLIARGMLPKETEH